MDPRQQMLDAIGAELRLTTRWTGRKALQPRVRAALAGVPRERFVPADGVEAAYLNAPLEIGHGQTISQPFIVALMTELLDLPPGANVLEVGTGSGYQAAVLADLTPHVCSIEIIPDLAREAAERLAALGYAERIALRTGDGSLGWPERAPFDGIVVAAAGPEVPPALVGQLRPGGRMIIPVGPPDGHQSLLLVRKQPDGAVTTRSVLEVAFVPLTHEARD
jgi:protein-L-isoaspartate(D-aspartate) O-methyltransferase